MDCQLQRYSSNDVSNLRKSRRSKKNKNGGRLGSPGRGQRIARGRCLSCRRPSKSVKRIAGKFVFGGTGFRPENLKPWNRRSSLSCGNAMLTSAAIRRTSARRKELPPIKKRGSTMRNSPNANLPKLFEEEKTKRGGHLTKAAFASLHAERTRGDAENIRKKLDYHLKRKT